MKIPDITDRVKNFSLFFGMIIIVSLLLIIAIYLLSGIQGLYISLIMILLIFGFILWMYYGLQYKRRERSPEQTRLQQVYDEERIRQIAVEDTYEQTRRYRQRNKNMNPANWKWFK